MQIYIQVSFPERFTLTDPAGLTLLPVYRQRALHAVSPFPRKGVAERVCSRQPQ